MKVWLVTVLLLLSSASAEDRYSTARMVSVTRAIYAQGQWFGRIQSDGYVEYRFSIQLVDGTIYVSSYSPRWDWSFEPTDLVVAQPVDVRIDGGRLFIKRGDGKELKTRIVQRTRWNLINLPVAR